MTHLTSRAHRFFARQHGIASVSQLRSSGLSLRAIERLEQVGAIELVLRGAYRTASVELDDLGRCSAVCLARPNTVVAGPTAGRLWNFRRLPRDRRIHVIAPPASNPAIARWVVPYRTAAIHPHDVVERSDGIRVTTQERTAFDLARHLGADSLLSVIEQAMRDGHLDEQAMRAVAVDWISPQRPWAWSYLRQLDRRLSGGAAESHPEVVVATALGAAGVGGLVRQYELRIPGYGPARFDLAIPRLRWAIEIDIFPTHDETIGRARDRRRDAAASGAGWTTHRLDRRTYETDLDRWIVATTAIHRSLLHPSAA
jgi:hypothetical protein